MTTSGQSVPHDSAIGHVTGEARFIDDIPPLSAELFVEFAGSPCASGVIEAIDLTEALTIDGVVGLFTRNDVPGSNVFGPIFADEPFLADGRVLYIEQPVVVIAAETRDAARRARDAVRITIREDDAVLTIGEAIRRGHFIGPARRIARGDLEAARQEAEHDLHGTMVIGGQEQFYLESQATIAYPGELAQMTLHSSTQNPTELQAVVAAVLGLGMHEVVCLCKRMGGAFGGKETQAALPALMAALVAHKTKRPARIVLDRDTDMKLTGKRHPYECRYDVAFCGDGRILGAKLDFFSNGGCAADLSTAVMERTLLHADNAYFIPNIEINGRVCRTNLPPNTAFRGFGGPQAVVTIENIVQEIATRLGMDALEVRRLNCYGVGERDVTPYGQTVRDNLLPEILDRLETSSDYRAHLERVEEFNANSPTQLRGLAMTPVKFGISFTTKFMNQANALVNVYADGSVQVSTGATEMGKGVNTKIRQLVADEFGIALGRVAVMITSTEKNINTSPTAASAGTDLNGTAAVRACAVIKERMRVYAAELLAPAEQGLSASREHIRFENGSVFDERNPNGSLPFGEFTAMARRERIDLGARGFYATPGIDFDRKTGKGTPFLYYTTGAAVAEVLVDRFTGELEVTRVDLLMDIGRAINPGVERGQVIGGFVQGMGWVTAEELRHDERGHLLSASPTTYKIPASTDVPAVFNVDFVDGTTNAHNLYGSKATGEPPLLLGVSVWAALKHALSFVAAGTVAPLALPATNEAILLCITELQRRQTPATCP